MADPVPAPSRCQDNCSRVRHNCKRRRLKSAELNLLWRTFMRSWQHRVAAAGVVVRSLLPPSHRRNTQFTRSRHLSRRRLLTTRSVAKGGANSYFFHFSTLVIPRIFHETNLTPWIYLFFWILHLCLFVPYCIT